jgi:hypothetical protein
MNVIGISTINKKRSFSHQKQFKKKKKTVLKILDFSSNYQRKLFVLVSRDQKITGQPEGCLMVPGRTKKTTYYHIL